MLCFSGDIQCHRRKVKKEKTAEDDQSENCLRSVGKNMYFLHRFEVYGKVTSLEWRRVTN